MQRRSLLRSLTTLPLVAALPPPLLAMLQSSGAQVRRVRPSDSAWPGAAEWQSLKSAVGGNLIEVRALFAPCEASSESEACQAVYHNIRNPFYIGDQPAGTQVS